jgi:hypothetical protein
MTAVGHCPRTGLLLGAHHNRITPVSRLPKCRRASREPGKTDIGLLLGLLLQR